MRRRRHFLRISIALLLLSAAALAFFTPAIPLLRYFPAPKRALMPVAGLRLEGLRGSFGAPRSDGPRSGPRRHEGVDLFAPRGTPVVAVTDGEVLRIGANPLGGNTVWMVGEGATLFYYAHLDAYPPRLAAGQRLRRGDPLGYVGNTGNALHTAPHLHFGAFPLANSFQPVDPVPLLRAWDAETLDTPGADIVP